MVDGLLRFALVGLAVPTLFGCSVSTGAPSMSAGSGTSQSTQAGGAATGDASAGGPLILGTLLPGTGDIAFLGPALFAGVGAAVNTVNAAGGVLGMPVQTIEGDSGDTQSVASLTITRAVDKGAQVIIGAASSSLSLSVIDEVIAAGALQFSPSNSSSKLSDPAITQGHYFRTTSTNIYEGSVLASLVFSEGRRSVAIMEIDDGYGDDLGESFARAFEKLGGTIVAREAYDPDATSFADDVAKVKRAKPDAIVLIGFAESSTVIGNLIDDGIGPQELPLYLCDGNMDNSLATGLPAGALKGVKGTIPGALTNNQMKATLLTVNPNLTDFSYGPEAYDTVIITALAAEAAASVAPADIAAQIPIVTAIGNTACSNYAACRDLLKAGTAISYLGPSGAQGLRPNGDPSVAVMGIWKFGPNNKISPIDEVSGDVPRA